MLLQNKEKEKGRRRMDEEDFFANYPPAGDGSETKGSEEKGSLSSTTTPEAVTQTTVADIDEEDEKKRDGLGGDNDEKEASTANNDVVFAAGAPGEDGEGDKVGEVMMAEKVEGEEGADEREGEEEKEDGVGAENEKVKKWRREFAKKLEEKVAREKKVKAERMEKATEVLTSMNDRWVKKCEKNREVNREQEKVFLAQRDGLIGRMSKKGEKPNWSLVENFADLTGKYKQGQRDTSRMRQVILRMKSGQQA